MPTDYNTVFLLLPELMLVLLAVWVFVGGTFTHAQLGWNLLAAVTFLLAGMALNQQRAALASIDLGSLESITTGPLVITGWGISIRFLAAVTGFLFSLFAIEGCRHRLAPERLGSLVLVFVGVMLVASARGIVLLFLGLELISIPTYMLLYTARADHAASESATKYFFLSLLASSILLYGFSMLYGVTGSLDLATIRARLVAMESFGEPASELPLAMVMIIAGFGFKIAAVPFHFYAADVYQGTDHFNAGLLAVVPKIAGIVGLIRVVVGSLPVEAPFGWQMIVVLSIITMTWGNAAALWQTDLRRLMAYSSIAHAGYLLIGLASAMALAAQGAPPEDGMVAMLVYVVVYSVASLGAFACFACVSREGDQASRISSLAGLGTRRPFFAALLAVFMFSLSGIPPLAGFWGKLLLFKSALNVALEYESTRSWFLVLAGAGAINAAVAAAYYLRVIGFVYFQAADPEAVDEPVFSLTRLGPALTAALCAVMVIAVAYPENLVGNLSGASGRVGETQKPTVHIDSDFTMTSAPNAHGGGVTSEGVGNSATTVSALSN